MEPALVVVLVISFGLIFRLIAGSFDGERVEQYVSERGWTLIDRSWQPFGPGWFGEKSDRIYEIVYRDERGDTHRAHVKTSMLSGVYLTNDRIVARAAETLAEDPVEAPEPDADLTAENERLRERVRELERQRGSGGLNL